LLGSPAPQLSDSKNFDKTAEPEYKMKEQNDIIGNHKTGRPRSYSQEKTTCTGLIM